MEPQTNSSQVFKIASAWTGEGLKSVFFFKFQISPWATKLCCHQQVAAT